MIERKPNKWKHKTKTKFSWNKKHYSMKTKPKSKNFNLQPPPSTINLHIIDNYFRCSIYFEYILGIEIMFGTSSFWKFWMFRVLSGIHLGSGSVQIIPIIRNTIKQDLFGIYGGFGSVRIYFYRIRFGSGFRIRFICPALANLMVHHKRRTHVFFVQLYVLCGFSFIM